MVHIKDIDFTDDSTISLQCGRIEDKYRKINWFKGYPLIQEHKHKVRVINKI